MRMLLRLISRSFSDSRPVDYGHVDELSWMCIDCMIHGGLQHGVRDRLLRVYAVIGDVEIECVRCWKIWRLWCLLK
jgi:hypothetical protein